MLTFDTLTFAEKLKQGGFTQQQAETQARAQAEIFGDWIENKLATKEDIHYLKEDIEHLKEDIEHLGEKFATKEDFHRLELTTKEDNKRLELATKEDMRKLESSTRADSEKLGHKIQTLEHNIQGLDKRVSELGLKLTVRLGGMLVVSVAVLASILKIF